MALGDGIRRNIKDVEPSERAFLRDAIIELNNRYFPGTRTDSPPGGVSWWFKQDEIHQSTHVHQGPAFIPWHRIIVNRYEELLRQIDPRLSLHYWNWTEDPRDLHNANLGGGSTGDLNLFTTSFMGYGGSSSQDVGEPWLSAGFYVPGAANYRSIDPFDFDHANPADPPKELPRSVNGSPATNGDDDWAGDDYAVMRVGIENIHDAMHGFVAMGSTHTAFRDPFVFLLHSNVDRLWARWQTHPSHPDRLESDTVYGSESGDPELFQDVEPWSGGFGIRPWSAPENQGAPFNYKHPSVVAPPCYDTNYSANGLLEVMNDGSPPVILFNDIPEGETGARAASFRLWGCEDVVLNVTTPVTAPFSILSPSSGSISIPREDSLFTEARIWFSMTAPDPAAAITDQSITINCPATGQSFNFILRGSVIEKPSVATMLVLDQSGSMSDPAGTSGRIRLDVLKEAARAFAEILPAGDAVGIVRFDQDAYDVNDATYPGLAMGTITTDDDFDLHRIAAIGAVNIHGAHGNTSVGDGVAKGRNYLNAIPDGTYTHKAMVVFTDGLQNEPQSIEAVSGSIDDRTYAIGLGNDMQVDTGALWDLTNHTGGFLLLTGLLSDSMDDFFRTKKYFQQILAGVTNDDIILDPNGYIGPGQTVRIPFYVNEADIQCSAILMWDFPVIDFMIETPVGSVINMTNAAGLGITAKLSISSGLYRFTLPVALNSGQHAGRWYVVLKINDERYKRYYRKDNEYKTTNSLANNGARYSVQINTRSNLKMSARVDQGDFIPGNIVNIKASLSEYGIPVAHRASCKAEVTRPDGSDFIVDMPEAADGEFEGKFNTTLVGIYVIRIMAKGASLRGKTFTREQTRNAVAQRQKGTGGGGLPTDHGNEPGGKGSLPELIARCCRRSTIFMSFAIIILIIILILIWRNSI